MEWAGDTVLLGCGSGRGGGWCAGFGRRSKDEAFADHGEALLGEFSLHQLVFRTGKEVSLCAGNGGDEVVDDNGLAVEGALLVGIGGQLDGSDGAGLFGDDGPQVVIVVGDGERQQRIERAGVKVGQKDGGTVSSEACGRAVAACGNVEQDLRGVWRGDKVDGGVIDRGAQLNVDELVVRG